MEVRSVAKFIKVQPRKVRLIAAAIRGEDVRKATGLLRYHTSKGAKVLYKVLGSAVANAQENHGISPENLRISCIMVDEGPTMKRITARSMGRANRINKKMSHVTVVVEEYEAAAAVKPHGTKAKPRPTFAPLPTKKKAAGKKEKLEETPAAVEEVAAAEPEAVEEVVAVEEAAEEVVEEAPAAEAEAEVSEPAVEDGEGEGK
ncbi:MAG: 50S ribosomal protein L22 [Fimbriimonadaceae bacterium]